MAAPARALSDSGVSAGAAFTAGAVFAGGFALGADAAFGEADVFEGAGFVLARRGAVRCGAARSRVEPSRLRFGSTKTPALPVRSPSCARAKPAPKAIAKSAQAKADRGSFSPRLVRLRLMKVLISTLILARTRPKLNRFGSPEYPSTLPRPAVNPAHGHSLDALSGGVLGFSFAQYIKQFATGTDRKASEKSVSATTLKQTPLNAMHRRLGGRMVEFGGWDMPVQYPSGTVEEHQATRTRAGLFDVSHMGEIEVRGPDAVRFVNRLCSNDASKLTDGQAQYTALTTERGTVVDDLLVYRFGAENLLLVVNASTTDKDWDWITSHKGGEDVRLTNRSADFCQIALQGPSAVNILQTLTGTPLEEIKYYHFREGLVDGREAIISRTGYTGEDGFEVYAAPEHAEQLWQKMLDAGRYGEPDGVMPCGLAARNTLRLEAGMALYGHEITEETTLLEANLGWITKLNKGDFTGRDALARQKEEGVRRRLVGFEVTDRGIARDGQDVYVEGEKVGHVTSGSPAPYLKKNIGMAYVPAEHATAGRQIHVDVRGRQVAAQIVPVPFYKRSRQ
jgi:aminomethyltransferase